MDKRNCPDIYSRRFCEQREFRYRIHLINQMQEGGCKVSKKAGDCDVRISYLTKEMIRVSRSSMQLYRLRGHEKILNGVWIHLSFVWHLFDFIPCGLCHVRMAMKENYYEIIWYSSICVVSIIYNHFLLQWRWSVKSTPDIRLFFSSFLFNILIFLNRNALIAYTYALKCHKMCCYRTNIILMCWFLQNAINLIYTF